MIYYFNSDIPEIIVASLVYIYSTLYFNPDMDIAHKYRLFSIKGLLTLPMRLFYAPFFKHRGISHTLLGTFTRLISMTVFLIIVTLPFLLVEFTFDEAISLSKLHGETILLLGKDYLNYILAGLAGVFAADMVHITSDRYL